MLREHLPSPAAPFPPRLGFRYLRCERVPLAPGGPLSGPPMTWTVCEKRHEHDRTIYYVRLDTWRVDGLSRALARKRYRQSVIVDARTLGPIAQVQRWQPRAETYVRQWRAYYRTTWQQMLERDAPCDLLRRRWWEWQRPLPAAVMMRSELSIRHISQPSVFYVGECVHSPQIPNDIDARSLGDAREIVAFAEIAPVVQADAGLERWCQRVWYLDHSVRLWGLEPLTDWRGIVDPWSLCAGLPSGAFDPRTITPVDELRRGGVALQREQFMRSQ